MTTTMTVAEFGRMVRDARTACGYSRPEAAQRLNVSPRQLNRYEEGESLVPVDVVPRMASVYGNPWIETTYCQCMCPMTGCRPEIRIGAELMNSLLQVSMYDDRRFQDALRTVYEIMADGVIDAGERMEFERSQHEIDTRVAQLLEVATCLQHTIAQARR